LGVACGVQAESRIERKFEELKAFITCVRRAAAGRRADRGG